jgi:hypothetical protein
MNQSKRWSAFLMLTVACSAVLFGCASGTVLRWTGQSEFEGKGGAVQTIDGIDFYDAGEPAGRYRVLSIVQGSYYRGDCFEPPESNQQTREGGKGRGSRCCRSDFNAVLSFRQFNRWRRNCDSTGDDELFEWHNDSWSADRLRSVGQVY